MLSRGTSSASQRPRRAKSSSSVSSRPAFHTESGVVDPDVLHQHALTAANLAYERASARDAGKNGASKADTSLELGRAQIPEIKPLLESRQSIRFAGPNAGPLMTRSITRREAPACASHEAHPVLVPPQATSYFANDTSLMHLPGEFGESDFASMQSSYRKLRKARSMFSPGRAPFTGLAGGTQTPKQRSQRHSWQSSAGSEEQFRVPDPRLRRSYSFLQGVTDRITASNRQYATHDAAIQLARDTYLQQLEQQRLRERPSFLKISKRSKPQKPFRRTVRSNSTNSYGTAVASPIASIDPPKIGLSQKARSLSRTLKKKIKRVFQRFPDDLSAIPAQQLNASHAHYRDYEPVSQGLNDDYPPVPEPNAALLRLASSRKSKEHNVPFLVDKSSRPGSIRSVSIHNVGDDGNDRSRVTSWTNCTAANTVTMAQTTERKRLSIIKEDGGPYQASSPSPTYENVNAGYAQARHTTRQNAANRVEAERVYSALQRKIDEDNRKAAFEETSVDNSLEHHRYMSTLGRTSSTDEETSSESPTFARQAETQNTYHNYQQDYAASGERLAPQEIAEVNEFGVLPSKGPLHEIKSSFFPPTMRIARSSTSPFRRLLKANSDDGDNTRVNTSLAGQPRLSGHVNLSRRRLNGSLVGSESIYSRSSGGHTVMAMGSSLSLPGSEGSGGAGTAIIVTSELDQHRPPTGPPIERRYSSAGLGGTWKRFMADQVATLEESLQHDRIHNIVLLGESGHRREQAQIHGGDVSIGRQQASTDLPKQPLGIIQRNANAQSPLKHKSLSSRGEEKPFMRTSSSPNMKTTAQNENAPFNELSAQPSKTTESESGIRGAISMADLVKGLRQKQSQASLVSENDQKRLSTTDNVRHSPERAERLRRLMNSSSIPLLKTLSQKENNGAHSGCRLSNRLCQKDPGSDGSDTSAMASGDNAIRAQKMVESFLRDRRREMRFSEESGTEPAFL